MCIAILRMSKIDRPKYKGVCVFTSVLRNLIASRFSGKRFNVS